MEGEHFLSISDDLLRSKICYLFYRWWALLDHDGKIMQLDIKSKAKIKMPLEISYCQGGKEERSLTSRYWHFCCESSFTMIMPLIVSVILLVQSFFCLKKIFVLQACLCKWNLHYTFVRSGFQWIIGCEDGSNYHLLLMWRLKLLVVVVVVCLFVFLFLFSFFFFFFFFFFLGGGE